MANYGWITPKDVRLGQSESIFGTAKVGATINVIFKDFFLAQCVMAYQFLSIGLRNKFYNICIFNFVGLMHILKKIDESIPKYK